MTTSYAVMRTRGINSQQTIFPIHSFVWSIIRITNCMVSSSYEKQRERVNPNVAKAIGLQSQGV
jgi:hypothetical protein